MGTNDLRPEESTLADRHQVSRQEYTGETVNLPPDPPRCVETTNMGPHHQVKLSVGSPQSEQSGQARGDGGGASMGSESRPTRPGAPAPWSSAVGAWEVFPGVTLSAEDRC